MSGRDESSGEGARVWRARRSRWILTWAVLVVVAAMAGVAFVGQLALWLRVFFVAWTAACVAGLFELAGRRVTVDTDRLTLVSNFRRRVIPRSAIESVSWAAGASAALKLVDGRWVPLPEVGPPTNQGLANSVRAWLKRTAAPDGGGRG